MIRTILAIALATSTIACTHVEQQRLTIEIPKPLSTELRPIEAMALFREAVASEDWSAVRAALAVDDDTAQQWMEVYKNEKNGHWLVVPVAESVRDDVALVIVSYRVRGTEGLPSPQLTLMVKVGSQWLIAAGDKKHWEVPKEQGDRLYALDLAQGSQLASFYMGGIGRDSYVAKN